MNISPATATDIAPLTALINSAYRGEDSKKGWTTEANLLSGTQRTDESSLRALLDDPQAVILKYGTSAGSITGCVYLQQQQESLYLGMLTVSPLAQGSGIGKQLLAAAEQFALDRGCSYVFMNVITARHELIDWYKKRGYVDTGRRSPFPTDHRFGVPTQELAFMILRKELLP